MDLAPGMSAELYAGECSMQTVKVNNSIQEQECVSYVFLDQNREQVTFQHTE